MRQQIGGAGACSNVVKQLACVHCVELAHCASPPDAGLDTRGSQDARFTTSERI